MDGDPSAALRERAREWGRSRLQAPPWADRDDRLTLLLVDPPAVSWATADPTAGLWLVIASADARTLPAPDRERLIRDGSLHERLAAGDGAPTVQFTAFTTERLQGVLEGAGRRSLEVRWSVGHAEPLHDPLRRHPELAAAAARLREDAWERIARLLYLEAYAGLSTLRRFAAEQLGDAVVPGGEAAGAVARLACVLEEGIHPPPRWLLPAAAQTALGRRVGSWLDDLPRALGGDTAAARRVADGCEPVLRAVEEALRLRVGGAEWLHRPEAWVLRPPR